MNFDQTYIKKQYYKENDGIYFGSFALLMKVEPALNVRLTAAITKSQMQY